MSWRAIGRGYQWVRRSRLEAKIKCQKRQGEYPWRVEVSRDGEVLLTARAASADVAKRIADLVLG